MKKNNNYKNNMLYILLLVAIYVTGLSVMVLISTLVKGKTDMNDIYELLLPALGIPLSYIVFPIKKIRNR